MTEVQARKDAIADAETLRCFAYEERLLPGLSIAAIAGEWAQHWIEGQHPYPMTPCSYANKAAAAAIRAAHAAFLAVPTLRGSLL